MWQISKVYAGFRSYLHRLSHDLVRLKVFYPRTLCKTDVNCVSKFVLGVKVVVGLFRFYRLYLYTYPNGQGGSSLSLAETSCKVTIIVCKVQTSQFCNKVHHLH